MDSTMFGDMKECKPQPVGSRLSNCYVFKSRLQEYAQKVGFPTPVYETIKEGPSHEPSFRSTVIVNGVRYDSLTGFFNRKAAEQSAAEVALVELAKSGEMNECISHPVHETGLCKNLLQEYAQKMNYAIPTYECHGGAPLFTCTVEIGGIRYIGAAAKTKKEAEIKAARTALLAIRSSSSKACENPNGELQYTVIPWRRKVPQTRPMVDHAKAPKSKKARFKKKPLKQRHPGNRGKEIQVPSAAILNNNSGHHVATEQYQVSLSNPLVSEYGAPSAQNGASNTPGTVSDCGIQSAQNGTSDRIENLAKVLASEGN
ncbi:Double-stranded RNA-binding protein 1 [Ancistrocladus abbreviatus]